MITYGLIIAEKIAIKTTNEAPNEYKNNLIHVNSGNQTPLQIQKTVMNKAPFHHFYVPI